MVLAGCAQSASTDLCIRNVSSHKLVHTNTAASAQCTVTVNASMSVSHHSSLISTYHLNPLESRGNYSATSNNMKLVHWPLIDELLHLAQPSTVLAVPNVTAHPSTASVPIAVLLYDGPLLCGFNVAIKGLRARLRLIGLCDGCQRQSVVGTSSVRCPYGHISKTKQDRTVVSIKHLVLPILLRHSDLP